MSKYLLFYYNKSFSFLFFFLYLVMRNISSKMKVIFINFLFMQKVRITIIREIFIELAQLDEENFWKNV